jgi:hypothetical protein
MKKKLAILAIFLGIFLVPMLAAHFIYHHPHLFHFKKTNYGELITPSKPIENLNFLNNDNHFKTFKTLQPLWLLIYTPKNCGKDLLNQTRPHELKQLQIAMGKDGARLLNLALLPEICKNQRPVFTNEIQVIFITPSVLKIFTGSAKQGQNLFIVDPFSELILMYKENNTPTELYKDLKQLLKVSQIG